MIKRFLSFALAATIALGVNAVPARRVQHVITQPDGTRLTITLQGDEHFHYFTTTDGVPVIRTADGGFRYAQLQGTTLKASTLVAHEATQRTSDELSFISNSNLNGEALSSLRAMRLANTTKSQPLKQRGRQRLSRAASATDGTTSQQPANITGQHRGLVVLVNFKDEKMQPAHTRQAFDDQFNLVGYNKNGNTGSVHDYFLAQSYGQLDVTFDVVGPVTLSKNMASYGGNDSNGDDKNPAGMVYEAIKLAKQQNPSLNFKDYDWNNDGEVDQVYLIYAGYGESSDEDGSLANTIWPHEWQLSAANYKLSYDGVTIDTYGCSPELLGNESYPVQMDGIGTACHEFSHCLGLPDLYDTSGSSNSAFGMDAWSLMDYGCYSDDGYKPTGYTSYERWMSGWLTPKRLTEATTITNMAALTESPEAYIIYNDNYPDEYYLLENRQQTGSDLMIEGHGLLVLHVDYDADAWFNNEVNNVKSHQRCSIIAADNKMSYENLSGDPFPGTSHKTQLTDSSRPAASLFHTNAAGTKKMNKPLTNITESATGLISFDFMGGIETGIHSLQKDKDNTPHPTYDAAGRYIGTMDRTTRLKAQKKSGTWLIQ